MAVPMSEAMTTLLRELTGAASCSLSMLVAMDACIEFSYFSHVETPY
ncbi:hypothetical protein BN136_2421 [Cronobacter universalis NCTC 9529]|nr:hypothetical protein BN136_2421 [Cronobacter universalis NCTC 9529]